MDAQWGGEDGRNRPKSADPGPWGAKQTRAAALLASGETHKDVAAAVGCGVRTLHTWLDDPGFRAFVGALRDHILAETLGKLVTASTRAASVLEGLLEAENEGVRLRAATAIIDTMIKTREHGELSARVTELEAQLAASGGSGRWRG
jgi:hypothetical protein